MLGFFKKIRIVDEMELFLKGNVGGIER